MEGDCACPMGRDLGQHYAIEPGERKVGSYKGFVPGWV